MESSNSFAVGGSHEDARKSPLILRGLSFELLNCVIDVDISIRRKNTYDVLDTFGKLAVKVDEVAERHPNTLSEFLICKFVKMNTDEVNETNEEDLAVKITDSWNQLKDSTLDFIQTYMKKVA